MFQEIFVERTNSRIRKYIKVHQEKLKYLHLQGFVRDGLSLPGCPCVVPQRSRIRATTHSCRAGVGDTGVRHMPEKETVQSTVV